jgi:hypothetical protein
MVPTMKFVPHSLVLAIIFIAIPHINKFPSTTPQLYAMLGKLI